MSRQTNRRDWLHGMAAGAVGLGMRGCCDPSPPPPPPPGLGAPSGLVVDVHCHVFNVADLPADSFVLGARSGPVRLFLAKHEVLSRFTSIIVHALSNLLTAAAPDDKKEEIFLDEKLAPADDPLALWDAGVAGFVSDLVDPTRSAENRPWTPSLPPELMPDRLALGAALRSELGSRPNPDALLLTDPGLRALGLPDNAVSREISGLLRWCRQMCDFRIRNIDRLFELFGPERRGAGIITPALVDFHRWLPDLSTAYPNGKPKVSISQQVDLMAKIIGIRPGVHPFVPVDPLLDWNEETKPLLDRCFRVDGDPDKGNGFIGVKLYPPLGFAPLHNEHLAAVDPSLPARVEGNLRSLYTYCAQYDVPVMAHCNSSNTTATGDAEGTASALKWGPVFEPTNAIDLEAFRGLRVNLAHFGGLGPFVDNIVANALTPEQNAIGKFMDTDRARVYSDIADEARVIEEQFRLNLVPALRRFLDQHPGRAGRLMYGTDWSMIGIEEHFPTYLNNWSEAIRLVSSAEPPIGPKDLKDRFFGLNALEFLGLDADTHGHRRLVDFYCSNFRRVPKWLKVAGASCGGTGGAGGAG